ncbi:hypothetical protein KHQ81_02690 [Mycoplasmatota bacterium]|nr:hypothetical protein KHQ81_02690 [Mycoplasmatota bacterium]
MNKSIKKQINFSILYIILGIVFLTLMFIFDFHPVFIGLSAAFLPTGILLLITYAIGNKNKDFVKKVENKEDERGVMINDKAGYYAFWTTFWLVFALFSLHYFIDFTLVFLFLLLILSMSVIYFFYLIHFNRKF